MRLTILSSVSVFAVLALMPVQGFSAFEFVAPKEASAPAATIIEPAAAITETQSFAPALPAPVVEAGDLPMPTTKESAVDLVRAATNPTMKTAEFGNQAVPLTPVIRESDALVIDTRVPSNTVRARVQDLPPLPPVSKPLVSRQPVVPAAAQHVAAIPAPVMPSNPYDVDMPVSSFGVVPDMQETIPVSSLRDTTEAGEIVQGFGRDVPLVLALQQIVPPSYRYSFDDGISPGMRISWSGDRPWKNIIVEIAQHNNMNVDIVSNVVAFHRGGNSSASRDTSRDMVPAQMDHSVPAMPAPVAAERVVAERVVTAERVITSNDTVPAPRRVAQTAPSSSFDPLLADDMPAKGKVDNKKILTADASTAVKAVDDVQSFTPESFAAPMPIMPVDESSRIVANVPRSSSENPVPVMQPEVVSASGHIDADMESAREWQAFKGETLRQALTAWSNNAGVSLVWSSEYDYPLQTDVRIASSYTDAVRTLLAGFSKAQPRPLGRLFNNNSDAAQPVLIIETQRLTN